MTVSAVRQNENSPVYTIVKSTAIGTAAGYAARYVLPVQKQEDTFGKRAMINYCRKITNKSKIEELEANGVKSKAQDVFISIAKSKDKHAFSSYNIAENLKKLGGKDSAAGKELQSIIRNVNEKSSHLAKRMRCSYKFMLKHKREAVPFLVAGGGIGFLTGFVRNVMKSSDFNV